MTEAEAIVNWAVRAFGDRLVVVSSMTDAVTIHMVSRMKPGVDVIFIDTGSHFPETIGTRDAIAETYDINVITPPKPMNWRGYPCGTDVCCLVRKVNPLHNALHRYYAWITGIRREETDSRKGQGHMEWDHNGRLKINPIIDWTQEQVDRYIDANDIIVNPLVHEGYDSIGCAPVTVPGKGREGRWPGQGKTECGIHELHDCHR